MTNMDKLYEAVEARGPVCVGLDTDFSYLPADFVDSTLSKGENIVRFNKKLIDATKAVAGCYKVQSVLRCMEHIRRRNYTQGTCKQKTGIRPGIRKKQACHTE